MCWTRSRYLLSMLCASPSILYRSVRAWRTLEPRDWSLFADSWSRVARLCPTSRIVRQFQAHSLRAARRFSEAVEVCQQALAQPGGRSGAILLELGRSLRAMGQRDAAIAAFLRAWHEGEVATASHELCRYGARVTLPRAQSGVFSPADYMSYLADNPVPPAPAPDSEILFSISVDGTEAEVSDTHASLVAQSYRRWFFKDEAPGGSLAQDLFSIRLCAGARLHPDALAWLAWAAAATASDEVYADHDHLGEGTSERRDPILLPMPDRYWQNDLAKPRCVARRVGARGNRSAHVPLVLASYPANSRIHGRARAACEEEVSKISVIIPTRDNPKLLEKAVATLMSTARGAENIEIIVVDNSSSGKDTRDLFDSIAQRCNFQLVPFDAPFNWSRANNLGAKRARGNILLFLNDDTELRASNWNSILASLWKDPMVGTVGARMQIGR